MKHVNPVVSWIIALWTAKVFLSSLPYKFTKHPDTEHIFGTIGKWMGDTINGSLGQLFSSIGSYLVGSFELVVSVVLLLPAVLWILNKFGIRKAHAYRATYHAIGGVLAAAVMAGAVFFHLFTPLGIEVIHQGKNDGGLLFYSAVSVVVSGVVLSVINRSGFSEYRNFLTR